MAKWVVIDVDGTLLPKTSMEKMFIIQALKEGILPKRNLLYFTLNVLIQSIKEYSATIIKVNKSYLKNLSAKKIQTYGYQLIENKILEKISKVGIKRIENLKSNNYKILIMSGSPDFLTIPLGQKISHDFIIATELEIENYLFTGRIKGIHPYGIGKAQLLLNLEKELQIDFDKSFVFANHHDDAEHMALFNHIVAVNPTKKLYNIAKAKKWKIQWWL